MPSQSPPHLPALRALRRALACGAIAVAALGLAAEVVHQFGHTDAIERFVGAFSMSYEQNVPTWYSTVLLWSCALALAAHALAPRPLAPRPAHFWGLATIFAYLSVDEAIELHEHLGGWLGTGGVLYFDWVIPAAGAVAGVAAIYWRFLWRLDTRIRRRFILAAALYVTGALLLELPLGWWTEQRGTDNLGYALLDWIEESLEIAGASVFLWALVEGLPQAWRPCE